MPESRSNGSRSNRPPPGRQPPQRRWWQRSSGDETERTAAEEAYESSAAGAQERLIIEALADLRDMDVREVMTPRADVVALTIPVTADDVAQAVRESGHSCFPVVNDDLDDLVGLLFVNDLFRFRPRRSGRLRAGSRSRPAVEGLRGTPEDPLEVPAEEPAAATSGSVEPSPLEISRRLRQPYVVPESRRILEALVEMRRQRRGFAVVVDEYGGVAGVLTTKDLLEPLVGDLHDEFDPADDEPAMVRVDDSRWLVDGRASVDDVRERLGMEVPDGDYVTLAGFLLDGLGHVPAEGESLAVDGWSLRVEEMDKRRIVKIVVRRPEEPATAPAGKGDPEAGRAAPSGGAEPASGDGRGRG